MSTRRLIGVALLAASFLAGRPLLGQELRVGASARHRLRYTTLLAGQYNPLGLQGELQVGYRRRLVESERLILSDTFAGAFASVRLNPAFARLGGGVELQPLAVLTLRALYEHRLYYGTFGMLQSFASPAEAYDETTLKARADGGASYAAHGHELTLQAVLRAKVGPIAFLDELGLVYYRMGLRAGDRVFYENFLDTLIPGDGFVLVNHLHLVFLHTRFLAGVRHTIVHALYPRGWGAENLNTPHHRLGPILGYLFRDLGPRLRQPTLILILNWWIDNRNRSPSANPYGVIAFQLSGDLWSR